MSRRAIAIVSAIGSMLLSTLAVSAQPLDLKASPPLSPRERFSGLDSERPPRPNGPAFVAPLSKETEGGRAGVAGWTSPNTAVGSRAAADPDNSGWLGFGFAMERGGSAVPRKRN